MFCVVAQCVCDTPHILVGTLRLALWNVEAHELVGMRARIDTEFKVSPSVSAGFMIIGSDGLHRRYLGSSTCSLAHWHNFLPAAGWCGSVPNMSTVDMRIFRTFPVVALCSLVRALTGRPAGALTKQLSVHVFAKHVSRTCLIRTPIIRVAPQWSRRWRRIPVILSAKIAGSRQSSRRLIRAGSTYRADCTRAWHDGAQN